VNRRTAAGIFAASIFAGALSAAAFLATGADNRSPAQSEADYGDSASLADLMLKSDLVVRATLIRERAESKEFKAPTGGAVYSRVDLVRTFAVLQVLSGDLAESQIETRATVSGAFVGSSNGHRATTEASAPALAVGGEFVLFLERLTPSDEPAFWAQPGEPGVARLVGGELRFIGTARYRSSLAGRGVQMPVADSDAPFAANLDDIARLRR